MPPLDPDSHVLNLVENLLNTFKKQPIAVYAAVSTIIALTAAYIAHNYDITNNIRFIFISSMIIIYMFLLVILYNVIKWYPDRKWVEIVTICTTVSLLSAAVITIFYVLINSIIKGKPILPPKKMEIIFYTTKKEVDWESVKKDFEKFIHEKTKKNVSLIIEKENKKNADIFMEDPLTLNKHIADRAGIEPKGKLAAIVKKIKEFWIYSSTDGEGDIKDGENGNIKGIPFSIEAFANVVCKKKKEENLKTLLFKTENGREKMYLYANAYLSLANTPIDDKTILNLQKVGELIDKLDQVRSDSEHIVEDEDSDNESKYEKIKKSGYKVFAGTWHWKYLKEIGIEEVEFKPVEFSGSAGEISAGVTKYLSFNKRLDNKNNVDKRDAAVQFVSWLLDDNQERKNFFEKNDILCPAMTHKLIVDWKGKPLIQSMVRYIGDNKIRPLYYLKDNEWKPNDSDNISKVMEDFIIRNYDKETIMERLINIIEATEIGQASIFDHHIPLPASTYFSSAQAQPWFQGGTPVNGPTP